MGVGVRLVSEDDAGVLTELLRVNRAFLAPWEPPREDEFFTAAIQRQSLARALARYAEGTAVPCVILDGEVIVGRVSLNEVVRSAWQTGNLGYWVSKTHNGRGIATTAVALMVELAFGELGLHRVQTNTLAHNVASQRVLARNGFSRIGTASRYTHIAGRWQDSIFHQRLNEPAD